MTTGTDREVSNTMEPAKEAVTVTSPSVPSSTESLAVEWSVTTLKVICVGSESPSVMVKEAGVTVYPASELPTERTSLSPATLSSTVVRVKVLVLEAEPRAGMVRLKEPPVTE